MKPDLQRRIQRYGWDKAAAYYEDCWQQQLKPAHDLLMEVSAIQPGDHILELAAGTGLITFRMAKEIGPEGSIIATDISDEMVQMATTLSRAGNFQNVRFERMDAESLDYQEATFDLVSCAMGLMYLPSPETAFEEMYRVLKPGGRTALAVWGSRSRCGWAEIFPIADARVKTDVCPMFFSLGEPEALHFPMKSAGFHTIECKRIRTCLHYASAGEACDAAFLGGPVALAYARFDDPIKMEAREEYIASIAPFKTDTGYSIPGEFVICTALKE